MCESTVKVHIRAIMKKLNARNRTQVVLLTNGTDCAPGQNSPLSFLSPAFTRLSYVARRQECLLRQAPKCHCR